MNIVAVNEIARRACISKRWGQPEYIDHGASAAVYKVDVNGKLAALKIYDPTFFEGENALIEKRRIELQKELKGHGCRYLVDVIEADELTEDGTWYLLMEFCPWKSLEKKLADVPDEKIHSLLKQLVKGVQFLDQHGWVHRDIKPANIAVSDDFEQLKLLDFGVMRRVAYDEGSGTDGNNFIATAQYSPPEFLLREEEPGEVGFQAINLYQVGAVLHDMITKTALFGEEKATKNKFKLYKAVTEKRPRVVSNSVPPRLIALCIAALEKDPRIRADSLNLDDFLADADDRDALRRRVSRGAQTGTIASIPTLAAWQSRIRSWGRAAAQLEAEALGAVAMKSDTFSQGRRWKLEFAGAEAPIFLVVFRVQEGLSVHVLSGPDADRGSAIFTIDAEGTSIPEAGIPDALAAQYLYALDLALTVHENRSVIRGE